MSRVVVIIEGGVVQDILVDDQSVDVMIIDYDTRGADPEDIKETHHGDEAFIYTAVKDHNPEEVDKFFNL